MLFDDKFGSVLKCIGKPKVAAGEGEWAWPYSHSLLYISTCNLICELLHGLLINHKDLEVHSLGSIPGHTTILELAQLIDSMWLRFRFILNPLFVCLFVHSFIFLVFFKVYNNAAFRSNMPEVTTGSRGY